MLGQGLNGAEWERWAESDKSYIIRQEGEGGEGRGDGGLHRNLK